jgi:hypothetical protein
LSDETKHLAAIKQNLIGKKKSGVTENLNACIISVHLLNYFLFLHHNGA